MDEFIRRENLALFKKRLAEPHSDAQHEILLELLAEEQAKDRSEKEVTGSASVEGGYGLTAILQEPH